MKMKPHYYLHREMHSETKGFLASMRGDSCCSADLRRESGLCGAAAVTILLETGEWEEDDWAKRWLVGEVEEDLEHKDKRPVQQTVQLVQTMKGRRGEAVYANGEGQSLRWYRTCKPAIQVPTCMV